MVVGIVKALPRIFVSLVKGVVGIFTGIWAALKNVFAEWGVGEWIKTKLIEPVVEFFQGLYQKAVDIWDKVRTAVSDKITALKTKIVSIFTSIKTKASEIFNSVKEKISAPINSAKEKVQTAIQKLKSTFVTVVTSIRTKASEIFGSIKEKMTAPIQKARDTIKGIVDKIKGFFSGMKLKFPNIKMPHFSISPSGWKIGDLLKGSIPKLKIDWYADGGIFTKPTIFPTAYGYKGVAEAGAEAVLPIDRLEGYIVSAIEKAQNNAMIARLASSIQDLASRPIVIRVGDRDVAIATASANDSVNGLRSTFKGRGLALD